MNLYKDRDGDVWVGSEETGVIHVNPHYFRVGYDHTFLVWSLGEASENWKLELVRSLEDE